MNEWLDLSETVPVYAWAVNQIVTVSDDGSGKALLVSLGSKDDDEMAVTHFLIDPEIAHAIGWEMIGTVSGYDSNPTLNGMTTTVTGFSILDDLGTDDE